MISASRYSRPARLRPALVAGLFAACLAAAGLMPRLCAAEPVPAALKAEAKSVLETNQDAIVTVKLVMKISTVVQGRAMGDQDQKSEVSGTVLNENGLTVVSIFASDPSAMYSDMSFNNGDGGEMQYERKTNIAEVKIILADGKEIPAEFVLRDKDLDLAFLRPKKVEQKFACVKLVTGLKPDLLDDLILVARMGTSVGRSPVVITGAISGVVKKPRTMYISTGADASVGMGLPVFNAQGQAIGIGVIKAAPNKESGRWGGRDMTPVILPSEDVLDAAEQAAKATAPEEPAPPKTPPAQPNQAAKDGENAPATPATPVPPADPKTPPATPAPTPEPAKPN